MTPKETLAKLKSLGNDKVRQHNRKNGADDNQFGVKLGDIRSVAKSIRMDNELAAALWKTSNVDAQLLATLIINPKILSASELEEMVTTINGAQVADWLNAYVVKEHPEKEHLRTRWIDSENKWLARAGWSLTSGRVARDPEGIDIKSMLDRIEAEMGKAPPEVQWTMNSALAQAGINFPSFRNRAIGIGEKLGVYRNYPVSKGCTSPFAPVWINEMVSRQVSGSK